MSTKKMWRICLLMGLMVVCADGVWAQDRIVRRDSTEIEAMVLTITPDEVHYKRYSNPDGPTYVLPVESIRYIHYPNGERDWFGREEERADAARAEEKGEKTQQLLRAYKVGDYYEQEDVRGVVCAVGADGLHGLILSLDEVSVAWSARAKADLRQIGATDSKDGRVNMQAVERCVASGEASWEDFPAFGWCRSLGDGWYLPAIDELLELCANYNGGTRVKNDRDARNRFNDALRKHGGKRMDRLVYYYSSTECDDRRAYCSHTSLTPPFVAPIPKGDRFLVRAVRRF